MLNFVMDYGVLQEADIDPGAPGLTTQDLTNPVFDEALEAREEIVTGQSGINQSPVTYLVPIVVFLVVLGFLQK